MKTPWDNVGHCRVPIWLGGVPSGYCGKPAFGEYIEGPTFRDAWTGEVRRRDGKWNGFVSGPCCPMHGGPEEKGPRVFRDGTNGDGMPMWCAVFHDFVNLQESPAAFDVLPWVAIEKLLKKYGPIGAESGQQ